ncbi:MAG: hypothetical protein WCH01_18355, partial [Methylococcaceae bacterium]
VANRVLYATQSDSGKPITVEGANGYKSSVFMYGVYGTGTPDWQSHLSGCVGPIAMTNDDGMSVFASIADQFSSEAMNNVSSIHNELLAEKEKLDKKVMQGEINGEEFANQVNQLIETKMREIADIIGEEAYIKVFNQSPEEPVTVMDPEIAKNEVYTVLDA